MLLCRENEGYFNIIKILSFSVVSIIQFLSKIEFKGTT